VTLPDPHALDSVHSSRGAPALHSTPSEESHDSGGGGVGGLLRSVGEALALSRASEGAVCVRAHLRREYQRVAARWPPPPGPSSAAETACRLSGGGRRYDGGGGGGSSDGGYTGGTGGAGHADVVLAPVVAAAPTADPGSRTQGPPAKRARFLAPGEDNSEAQYLHPNDGVFPEKVNEGRVGVGNIGYSISKNPGLDKARERVLPLMSRAKDEFLHSAAKLAARAPPPPWACHEPTDWTDLRDCMPLLRAPGPAAPATAHGGRGGPALPPPVFGLRGAGGHAVAAAEEEERGRLQASVALWAQLACALAGCLA